MKAFSVDLCSIRATLFPLLCIWGFSTAVIASYFLLPSFHRYFDVLQAWHEQHEVFAVLSDRLVFCGFVPAVFMYAVKGLRQKRTAVVCLVQVAWSCVWGVICNAGFRLQEYLFGSGADWMTLLLKTSVDQFVFTPLVISPAGAVFCFWLARDLSFRRTLHEWPQRFFCDLVAPNLLANWCIAIPVTFMIFSFPTALQIHVNSLNCSFAALLFLQIGKRTT